MAQNTGVSMGGSIDNINNIKSVKAVCSKCYHRKKDKTSKKFYCDYYKSFSINKTRCIRFTERPKTISKKERPKKMTKAERLESYKKGLVDTTWIKTVDKIKR